ncbi:MAG TPA: hypothetical protein VNB24_09010 [Acidimicrobiales bacterium]|nr:hypothetical protein [Acidimicrobiales bacterium]
MGPVAAPTHGLLAEVLFGRPSKLKIFVSSQMRGGALNAERVAAAEAIESTTFHEAWYWERDANAGPYCAEHVCVGHAGTSDGLVLLLADELTPITRKEFEAAEAAGAPCFVLIRDGAQPSQEALDFVREQQGHAITTRFGNDSELRTRVVGALLQNAVSATRRDAFQRRMARGQRRRRSDD